MKMILHSTKEVQQQQTATFQRIPMPNMVLIAGDGRNVGKTFFASELIRKFSKETRVTAVKTTPHYHVTETGLEVLHQTDSYVVALELGLHNNDTGLFLKAGATKVYFIMAGQEHAGEAFSQIAPWLSDHLVIAESGSLIEYVKPGLFFFLKNHDGEIKKQQYLKYKPLVVSNKGQNFDFDIEKIKITNGPNIKVSKI